MKIKNPELWLSAIFIAIVTSIYIQVVNTSSIPAASSLFGHSLGIAGFVLMLMTEILYSIRKRYQFARWGKLQHWLSFHIFTGIVGPYLVLLHTSWKFNGLAGILTLFTLIIVISGFVGRYFYTAVPRSADGQLLEAEQISAQITSTMDLIKIWQKQHPDLYEDIAISLKPSTNDKPMKINRKILRKIKKASGNSQSIKNLNKLLNRQEELEQQLLFLDRSRRLLAIWHTVHVPLGMAMFFIAFVHIFATLYYATLLH